jgi:hypothetical protein
MTTLLELLKQKKQDLAASRRRKTVKPLDGNTRWRILPSWRGEGQQFWHDFGQHFVKNSAKELTAIYMCTDKTFGKPCSICDAIKAGIKSATDESTMDLLKEAASTGRVLLNALHLDSSKPEERVEPQILELPPSVFSMILDIAAEWEEAGESIFDVTAGKDLIINRVGTGKNTKYTVQAGAKVTPVPAGVLAKLHDLDAYVQQESNEQQLRALNSVRSVTGLLPAPSSSGLPPAAAAMGAATLAEDDDPYAVAKPPSKPAAAAKPAADVEDVVGKPLPKAAAPAPAPAPAPAAVPAPAPAASPEPTGDDELDAMLASLGS